MKQSFSIHKRFAVKFCLTQITMNPETTITPEEQYSLINLTQVGRYAEKYLQIRPTKCCEEILGFLPKQQD